MDRPKDSERGVSCADREASKPWQYGVVEDVTCLGASAMQLRSGACFARACMHPTYLSIKAFFF